MSRVKITGRQQRLCVCCVCVVLLCWSLMTSRLFLSPELFIFCCVCLRDHFLNATLLIIRSFHQTSSAFDTKSFLGWREFVTRRTDCEMNSSTKLLRNLQCCTNVKSHKLCLNKNTNVSQCVFLPTLLMKNIQVRAKSIIGNKFFKSDLHKLSQFCPLDSVS